MYAFKPQRRTVLGLLATATLALGLVAPGAAGAAGPAQVAPKRGAVVAVGSQPTFKVRDASSAARKYGVFITISTTKRRKANGDLKTTDIGTFARMKRRGSRYSFKPKNYTFPTWFMARPGTYYWQAYRIDCSGGNSSCHVPSKIRSFKVQGG